MAEFALSTNMFSYALAKKGVFGWPATKAEGELVKQLIAGDVLIPKFADGATFRGEDGDLEWQRSWCEALDLIYDATLAEYNDGIGGGVPFLLRVTGDADDEQLLGETWVRVNVERVDLDQRLDTKDFLLLRALPPNLAAQFKGAVAQGRHLQEVPDGTARIVCEAAAATDRSDFLRRYTLVEAVSVESAAQLLTDAGRAPRTGDRCFIASSAALLGLCDGHNDGTLAAIGEPIPKTPAELLELFEEAKTKATERDRFSPSRAIAAARELQALLDGPTSVVAIDDFARFYDGYSLLANKVTQALAIITRPAPVSTSAAGPEDLDAAEEPSDVELDELATLQGLTVADVRNELPDEMELPDSILAEAVTALRAGKHLLLGGPPGTGKSTLAESISRAVVGQQYDVVTATADWTTFDTVGGYMPKLSGELEFTPGVVLRCLRRGRWLTIDELNRADIDKAFGPLFTLLAGTGSNPSTQRNVLPFQTASGKNIEIRWAEKRTGDGSDYILTPGWRLIGTLNLSDKATLFQLSFAFLRRFAVINVPLPPEDQYRKFFAGRCAELPDDQRNKIVDAGIKLATNGPRQLGPAILGDVAEFMQQAVAQTASGAPTYNDVVDAFATAIRLFAVPQYEGATSKEVGDFFAIFPETWPDRPKESWDHLKLALDAVALT